jgi:hypothetical protein
MFSDGVLLVENICGPEVGAVSDNNNNVHLTCRVKNIFPDDEIYKGS